jgi:hypothetical protein
MSEQPKEWKMPPEYEQMLHNYYAFIRAFGTVNWPPESMPITLAMTEKAKAARNPDTENP